MRILLFQLAQPFPSHPLSPRPRLEPDIVKVSGGREILSNRNGIRQVQDGMPPALRNVARFPGMLRKLKAAKVLVLFRSSKRLSFTFDSR